MNTIHVVQASALRSHATTHTIPLDATSRMALFTGPRSERRRALSDQQFSSTFASIRERRSDLSASRAGLNGSQRHRMVVGLTSALTCVAIAGAHFVIVAYENRPGITSMLQQSAEESSVTFRAGALAPRSVRRYHSADRPAWLERELENHSSSSISSAEVVIHATRVPPS